MKLGTRIFIAYLLIFVVCFSYPTYRMAKDLRTRYHEGFEDPLVDVANILAAMVGTEMEMGRFDPKNLYLAFQHVRENFIAAKVYDLLKTDVDAEVYITDASGKVLFDSQNRQNIGTDYSNWRDVRLTLQGRYGARATRRDPNDPYSVVLYVAAPIVVQGKTVGVLTVGKPTTDVNGFVKMARPRIIDIWLLSSAAAILLSFVVSSWITVQIRRLTQYAHDVREGKKARLPELGRSELREMAMAFETMREALEGRKYAEQYVQALTHEIKSPLSAIQGAAELLQEEMPPGTRARFLSNIRSEANRARELVDRMLRLSELENKRFLEKQEPVSMHLLVRTVIDNNEPLLSRKQLSVEISSSDEVLIKGDAFLLLLAVSNLIQNAIDFSPTGGRIEIGIHADARMLNFTVDDEGPGIPEYAREKVFERFFSLQRPETGKKSTGLGLNLAREAVHLHRGEISLQSRAVKGLRAVLRLPV
ncbi:MAG: two-component system sensor histidine kinase CreC [Syntrophobacteraceae bacterium]